MNRNEEFLNEYRHGPHFNRLPPPPYPAHNKAPRDDTTDLNAIAHSEGWLTPPSEVTRITLKPWQQGVFWGLRAYIVVMLLVMGFGFVHGAGG